MKQKNTSSETRGSVTDAPDQSSAERRSLSTTTKSNPGDRLPLSRYALFFLLLTAGLTADLWTKSYVFANFFDPVIYGRPQRVHWWFDNILGLQTSTNPGALFGMGKGLSWLFALLSIVALSGIFTWLFVWRAARDRWITVALGLISGGILGNLYDRLGFGFTTGFPEAIRTNVRDWILFRWEGIRMFDPWPNFNIADALLVTGAIMLVIHAIFAKTDEAEPTPTSSNDSD